MASDSAIAKLAAKPLGFQIGVLVACLLAICGIYYQLMYSDLDEELTNAKSQYTRLERENKKAKDQEIEYKKLVKEKGDLDRQLNNNQVSLPATAALPSFIGHMQRQAAVAGVSFKNWSRKPEEKGAAYVRVPVSVEVIGNFHQVLKYFHLLGKTKRIITIEDFKLTPDKSTGDDVVLKATFQATTFRQPDGAAPKPTAEQPVLKNPADAKAKKEADLDKASGLEGVGSDEKAPSTSGVDRLKNPGAK